MNAVVEIRLNRIKRTKVKVEDAQKKRFGVTEVKLREEIFRPLLLRRSHLNAKSCTTHSSAVELK